MAESQQIDISKLPIDQLQKLKTNFEQEVEQLGHLISSLRSGSSRFNVSASALMSTKDLPADTEIMVPLTSSLYAPGTLSDPSKAMIDIGTGYFVEKRTEDAIESMKTKIAQINAKVQEAQLEFSRKSESLNTVTELFQVKMAALQQDQLKK